MLFARDLKCTKEKQKQRLQRMQSISFRTDSQQMGSRLCPNGTQTQHILKMICYGKNASWLPTIAQIKLKYNHAKQRLILLDYDKVRSLLSNHVRNTPNLRPNLFLLYNNWLANPANRIVINQQSGSHRFQKWLGRCPFL